MAQRRQATRRPRGSKKVDEAFKILAEMAAQTGAKIEVDAVKQDLTTRHVGDNQETARKLTGTAMMGVLSNGEEIGFAAKDYFIFKCRREGCGASFMTNYKYDKYCSSSCTRDDLRRYGFEYDETKPLEERWSWQRDRYNIPLKIPPSALDALLAFARDLLASWEEFQQRQEDDGKPGAATHYLWKDRGLSQERLDEFYPIDRESTTAVDPRPENPESENQEEPESGSATESGFELPDLGSLLEDDLDF